MLRPAVTSLFCRNAERMQVLAQKDTFADRSEKEWLHKLLPTCINNLHIYSDPLGLSFNNCHLTRLITSRQLATKMSALISRYWQLAWKMSDTIYGLLFFCDSVTLVLDKLHPIFPFLGIYTVYFMPFFVQLASQNNGEHPIQEELMFFVRGHLGDPLLFPQSHA